MRYFILFIGTFLACFHFAGCARVTETATETAKVIWGSSTRALEKARADALGKTYECAFDNCFDAVAGLGQEGGLWGDQRLNLEDSENEVPSLFERSNRDKASPGAIEEAEQKLFYTFIKNREKRHIVFIRVPGSVNSTEVGVFFSELGEGRFRVEVSSLSRYAKKTVAEAVFAQLDKIFPPRAN